MTTRTFVLQTVAALMVGLASSSSYAQGTSSGAAGPEGMPPEIAAMLGGATGGEVAIAPPSQPTEPQPRPSGAPTVAGTKYLFTTLRVVNNGNPRGCSYANWDCMTNLCKSDLQDNAAWRGWSGCWREGNNYICYFECGQTRNAF